MKKIPKYLLIIIMILSITIITHAYYYIDDQVSSGMIVYLEDDIGYTTGYQTYFCSSTPTKNYSNCIRIFTDNNMPTPDEFNAEEGDLKISEIDENGNSMIGWKIAKIEKDSRGTDVKIIYLVPYYGVKQKFKT